MSFKIVAAVPGAPGAPSTRDGRSVVQSMFYNWDAAAAEGENLVELPVSVGDCSKGTPKDLGIVFENCISVQLNYKGDVDAFNGRTKGKNLITLGGKRQGRSGYGSVTMPLDEVPEFCDLALRAHRAISTSLTDAAGDTEAEDEVDDLTS